MTVDEKSCASIVLGHDRLVPVCVPDAGGEPMFALHDSHSAAVPVLSYPPETFFGRLLNGIIRFSPAHPQFSVVAQSPHARILRMLALNGSGIAWVPERCIYKDLQEKKLTFAGGEQWHSSVEIRLYASPERAKLLESNLWENIVEWQEPPLTVA